MLRIKGIEILEAKQNEMIAERQRVVVIAIKNITESRDGTFTMRKVADEAGFTLPYLYRLFSTKDGIYVAILEYLATIWKEFMFLGVTEDEHPWVKLSMYGMNYLKFSIEQSQMFDVLSMFFTSLRGNVSEEKPFVSTGETKGAKILEQFQQHMKDLISLCCDGGVLDGDDDDISLFVWAMVHGLSSVHVNDKKSSANLAAMIEQKINIFLRAGRSIVNRDFFNSAEGQECSKKIVQKAGEFVKEYTK